MKKILVWVVLAVVLVSCMPFALAEKDFQLRNGIVFGDTMEEILQKETTLTRNGDDSNWFTGKIAGYSDAECGFMFDDDGKLEAMRYTFGNKVCYNRDRMNDVYKSLCDSLKRKYGNPLGNVGGSCYIITGPAIESMSLYVYLLGSLDGYAGDYTDYDEWIVDSGDDHVKIDLISYYYRDDDFKYYYFVDVSYKYFTDADIEAAQNEKQGARDEVDNDM